MPYTMIAVPDELVDAVTDLIESTDREEGSPRHAEADGELINGWSAEQIRERYGTAREEMQRTIDFLAANSGETFGMPELEKELGLSYDKLNGLLGGFSKVNRRVYGSTTFPWNVVEVDGRVKHGMPEAVAQVVREARARA